MEAQDGSRHVNRREALRRLAVGSAAAATLPTWVDHLSAFALDHAHAHGQRATAKTAAAWKPRGFTPHQNQTLIAVSELIIPQTDTPGAKAANVNRFIDSVLADAPRAQRDDFIAGLAWLDERAKKDFAKPFVEGSREQQTALLTRLSELQQQLIEKKDVQGDDRSGALYFEAFKSLTIIGYYTSEVGMKQEMGDDGTLFFAEFKGCEHPEHRGS